MQTIENPAPLAGGNRAKTTDFIDGEIENKYSPIPLCEQPFPVKPYGQDPAIAEAPDETIYRIICLHWNIPSKQIILRQLAELSPVNDNRRTGQ